MVSIHSKSNRSAWTHASNLLERVCDDSAFIFFRYRRLPAPRCEYVSPSVADLLGYTPDNYYVDPDFARKTVHVEDAPIIETVLDRPSATASAVTIRWRRPDGSVVPTVQWIYPILDESGNVEAFEGVAHVADHRRTSNPGRTGMSAERYRDIFDQAPIGIIEASPRGDIVVANPAVARMLGYDTPGDIEKLHLRTDIHRDPAQGAAVLSELAERHVIADREVVWKRRDGSDIWVRLDAALEHQADAVYYEFFVRDVTPQKKLEEQLAQAQKLEAIGRLAGGIAHDFNNLITAILTPADLLLMDLPPNDRTRSDLEDIRAAAFRASELTGQLLAFSRKQIISTTMLDIDEVVGNLQRMLRRLIGEDIQLHIRLGAAASPILGDRTQIEQVVLNLATNARDAMPQGGRLTIETGSIEFDQEYVSTHPGVAVGRHVLLAVSDTGHGMDEATRTKAFEPFFTTKESGKGTGLGLATVYGIVRQLGGHVWVYSEPGHGSTFKVFFPVASGQLPVTSGPVKEVVPPAARGETVLVVEDEPAVREISARALRRFGYDVLTASTGAEALAICKDHSGTIHLLLSDVVMPEMGGARVHERVRELRPDVKVLYMSGYTDDAVIRHGILEGEVSFLSKPFTPLGLARRVREVLDGAAP